MSLRKQNLGKCALLLALAVGHGSDALGLGAVRRYYAHA
jgi:hypothetical protein